jgi:hypothetical protein
MENLKMRSMAGQGEKKADITARKKLIQTRARPYRRAWHLITRKRD